MAPSMSLVVRPASAIARRAASAATMRSERSCCAPATTPRPTIAYLPDDGCLGTFLILFENVLRRLRQPLRGRRRREQAHARSWSRRQPEHAFLRLQALERIVEQPVELTEFAGIVDAWQRAGE